MTAQLLALPGPAAPGSPGTVIPASRNMNYGISQDNGDDSGARRAIAVLAGPESDIVLFQETHTAGPCRLRRHLRRFASEPGMQPVLGPAGSLRLTAGSHTAMLLAARITIHDEWPPRRRRSRAEPAGTTPAPAATAIRRVLAAAP
jgi:hypothetical protein